MYVQFRNELKDEIISIFSCPQDDMFYPNQGEVTDNDPRYLSLLKKTEIIPVFAAS